jgi:hypothetical protein
MDVTEKPFFTSLEAVICKLPPIRDDLPKSLCKAHTQQIRTIAEQIKAITEKRDSQIDD